MRDRPTPATREHITRDCKLTLRSIITGVASESGEHTAPAMGAWVSENLMGDGVDDGAQPWVSLEAALAKYHPTTTATVPESTEGVGKAPAKPTSTGPVVGRAASSQTLHSISASEGSAEEEEVRCGKFAFECNGVPA